MSTMTGCSSDRGASSVASLSDRTDDATTPRPLPPEAATSASNSVNRKLRMVLSRTLMPFRPRLLFAELQLERLELALTPKKAATYLTCNTSSCRIIYNQRLFWAKNQKLRSALQKRYYKSASPEQGKFLNCYAGDCGEVDPK